MDVDPRYSAEVLRRLRELPGAGDLDDGGGVLRASAGAVRRGARVELALRIADGRVADARFRAYGCPHFIAAASWLTEQVRGMRRAELAAWDWRDAAEALTVPPAKFGRLITLQDAARAAAASWAESAPPAV